MERRRGEERREREGKKSSDFSLRSTEFEWLSRIGPRLKVGVLIKGNAWTPKSRVFVEDSSEDFGKSKVSGLGNASATS